MSTVVRSTAAQTVDRSMPELALALQPQIMERDLARLPAFASAVGHPGRVPLKAVHLRRHKPGRRCLIEYVLEQPLIGADGPVFSVLGKIRAKGLDRRSFEVQECLWNGGFGAGSSIAVAQPLGVLPRLGMWVQAKVQGTSPLAHLWTQSGSRLTGALAEGLRRLQCADLAAIRLHTIDEELRILSDRLEATASARPEWRSRLLRILTAARALAATLPRRSPRPCHRDFYHDNLLMADDRLILLDLDTFCYADPALDAGNFIGHVLEYGLRSTMATDAIRRIEQTLEESFSEALGLTLRSSVSVYTTLTLVRHIAISAERAERQVFTLDLISLCERRLGI